MNTQPTFKPLPLGNVLFHRKRLHGKTMVARHFPETLRADAGDQQFGLAYHHHLWLDAGMAFCFMPAVLLFFVANTLAIGLGCGYLMVKSDSIWGATLIHVTSDFFLFVAVLANA